MLNRNGPKFDFVEPQSEYPPRHYKRESLLLLFDGNRSWRINEKPSIDRWAKLQKLAFNVKFVYIFVVFI